MFKTIIWATDGSQTADEALLVAKELATGEDRKLVVVHNKELLIGRGGGYPVLVDEHELEAKITNQVAEAKEEGIDVSLRIVTGVAPQAAHVIADAAREVGADVIVVGTRGHAAVAGLLLGSVTLRLLHIAPCPVLAVPPRRRTSEAEPAREATAAR